MRSWVAVFKAYFSAPSYSDAVVVAEVVRQNAEHELDSEHDEVDTVLVLPLGTDGDAQETATLLRRARNSLIRLGNQRTVDVAREVDMIATILSEPAASMDYHKPYDYGEFLKVVGDVMAGKDPGA
jgi:hypothetical protein